MTIWRLAGILFLVTAGLFVVGVAAERRGDHHEFTGPTEVVTGQHDEIAEGTPEHEAGDHDETTSGAESGEAGHGESDEDGVLGIDVESPLTVSAAIVMSMVLAVVLWLSERRWLAAVAAGFAVVFAALDVGEVIHQVDERRSGLVVLAATLAVGHLTAGILASRSPHRVRL